MKRKHLLFTFSVATLTILGLSFNAIGHDTGAAGGNTGAPGETNCARSGCHSSNATKEIPDLITTNIPATGYIPGETYRISATASKMGGKRFGFEVTAKDEAQTLAGEFANISANTKTIIKKYITHTLAGTSATDTKTWEFDWTAPDKATGDITFYGAFNLANNDGTTFGDQIVLSSLKVSINPKASVDLVDNTTVNIYPKPFNDNITIELPNGAATIDIYSNTGQKVASFSSDKGGIIQKDLSWLDNGMYFVRITTGNHFYSERIMKVF